MLTYELEYGSIPRRLYRDLQPGLQKSNNTGVCGFDATILATL
jgi:hypothetical protein